MEGFEKTNKLLFAIIGVGIMVFLGFLLISKGNNNLSPFNNLGGNGSATGRQGSAVNSFTAFEAPTFNFPSVSYTKDLENNTAVYNSNGQKIEAQLAAKQTGNGTAVKIINTQQFTPGKYKIEINANGKKIDQDFAWGVLAINPNKSIYSPNETAYLALAVLDASGKMVCDAKVTLVIKDPGGKTSTLSTSDKSIIVNPECNQKKYTEKPDYETKYVVGTPGSYQMDLTAQAGRGAYSIRDFLKVQENVDFDVERITATRIFPSSAYPVAIKITVNTDFSGQVKEIVPSSFTIGPLDQERIARKYDSIQNNSDSQTIIWNVSIKKGQSVNIGYKYNAPLVSPQFYLLGPLSLVSQNNTVFEESRNWQIAADDITYSAIIKSTSGLVSYWRLGEASGTNTQDGMGIQNGTYSGTYALNASGAISGDNNGSFNALGTGYVNIPHQAAYALTANFSLESWFKRNGGLGTAVSLFNKQNNDTSWGLNIDTSNKVHFGSASWDACISSTAYTDTNWHQVIVTWGTNGAASCKMYIDGSDVTTNPVARTFTTNVSAVQIGAWVSGSLFPGYIDDVAFYNVVLTPAQVLQHYNLGVKVYSPYARKIINTPGLKGYWRLNESSGQFIDVSGKGHDTTSIVGSPTYLRTGALIKDSDTAIYFTRSTSRGVVPDHADFAVGSGPFTVEFWAKLNATGNIEWMLGKWSGTDDGWSAGKDATGALFFYDRNNPSASTWWKSSETPATDTNWHHYVFAKNGAYQAMYFDGIKLTNSGDNGTLQNNSYPVGIGAPGDNSSNSFGGTLDEVAFYNLVLTPAQVMDHYKAGNPYAGNILDTSGLVSYWRLGEASGQFVDMMGGHNTSSIQGAPAYGQTGSLAGDANTAVHLTRQTDWGNVPANAAFNIGDGPLSVEFWAKNDVAGQTEWMFGKWDGSDDGWAVGEDSGNLAWYDRNNPSPYIERKSKEICVNDTTNWHYYVFTKNGASLNMYCDGVQLTPSGSPFTMQNNAYSVGIGSAGNSTSNSLGGVLDEVAFYNAVLSPAQVWQHYYLGVSQGISTGIQGARLQGLRLN